MRHVTSLATKLVVGAVAEVVLLATISGVPLATT